MLHNAAADIHIIIEIEIYPHAHQILKFTILAILFQLKLMCHGGSRLDSGKHPKIQTALFQPVTDDPFQILFHHRRHFYPGVQFLLSKNNLFLFVQY